MFGIIVTGPRATAETRYYIVLAIVVAMTWIASNIVHGRIGRTWMAVRDMDIAAELMGIRLLPTKLLAFAVSSFYCGVSGAMMVFLWYGGAESTVFNINQSFTILFMIIIGGLGSLLGSFLGAALIYMLPIVLRFVPPEFGIPVHAATIEHITFHGRGRADRALLDRRAGRPGAAVANRQAETEGVAVSVLMVQDRVQFPPVADTMAAKSPPGEPDQANTENRGASGRREPKGGTTMKARRLTDRHDLRELAGGAVLAGTAQAQDTIYVPLLTYRTGPVRRIGHSDRQRHARLSRPCSTSATAASAA